MPIQATERTRGLLATSLLGLFATACTVPLGQQTDSAAPSASGRPDSYYCWVVSQFLRQGQVFDAHGRQVGWLGAPSPHNGGGFYGSITTEPYNVHEAFSHCSLVTREQTAQYAHRQETYINHELSLNEETSSAWEFVERSLGGEDSATTHPRHPETKVSIAEMVRLYSENVAHDPSTLASYRQRIEALRSKIALAKEKSEAASRSGAQYAFATSDECGVSEKFGGKYCLIAYGRDGSLQCKVTDAGAECRCRDNDPACPEQAKKKEAALAASWHRQREKVGFEWAWDPRIHQCRHMTDDDYQELNGELIRRVGPCSWNAIPQVSTAAGYYCQSQLMYGAAHTEEGCRYMAARIGALVENP